MTDESTMMFKPEQILGECVGQLKHMELSTLDELFERVQSRIDFLDRRISEKPEVPVEFENRMRLEMDSLVYEKRELEDKLLRCESRLSRTMKALESQTDARRKNEHRLDTLERRIMKMMD